MPPAAFIAWAATPRGGADGVLGEIGRRPLAPRRFRDKKGPLDFSAAQSITPEENHETPHHRAVLRRAQDWRRPCPSTSIPPP